MLSHCADAIDVGDLVVLIVFGWYAIPLFRLVYRVNFGEPKERFEAEVEADKEEKPEDLPYASSVMFSVAQLISQIAKLAFLVYLVDCTVLILDIVNPDISFHELRLNQKIAEVALTSKATGTFVQIVEFYYSIVRHAKTPVGGAGGYCRIACFGRRS